tara:strand:- start:787 stop:1542 length:756 start_codon:yes stop_codon:yes gene_type:complete
MQEKEYKDIKKKAIYLTILSNFIFFILLFIIIAWTETYPPPEEYGIEIGTEVLDNTFLNNNDENAEDQTNDIVESSNEKLDETITENIDDKLIEEEVKNTNNIENNLEEEMPIPKNVISEKNTDKSENNVSLIDSSSIIKENKPNKIDERALFNSKSSSGEEGSSLEMQGWIWDFLPNPKDNSSESGKIVFELIVDYYGDIIGLKTLETTLSPKVEKIYREEILKLTFSPTNNNNPAEISKGKITFIIKNN